MCLSNNRLCRLWCIWYFKGTNSKANYNCFFAWWCFRFGVFDISKVQIQKQITTVFVQYFSACRCIWYFKGTNSKANYNQSHYRPFWFFGVFDISKVQIQKQITTTQFTINALNKVYLIFQRYKFKSKLQLWL